MTSSVGHVPVLTQEIEQFHSKVKHRTLLDATIGHGGHSLIWLQQGDNNSRVYGIDADPQALKIAGERLAPYHNQIKLGQGNFAYLKDLVVANHDTGGEIVQASKTNFSHVLFDLGVGSHQLADSRRGFSFKSASSLSMLYGQQSKLPPSQFDFLNHLQGRLGALPDVRDIIGFANASQLAHIIKTLGEERYAMRIAKVLCAQTPPQNAEQLADMIKVATPAHYEHGRIHTATRTFQALRMAVNRELECLTKALPQAIDLLAPDGIIAVISFHSLEDRIVKNVFRLLSRKCICPSQQPECTCERVPVLKLLTKKPVRASEAEVIANPRARSAKLRVAQRFKT